MNGPGSSARTIARLRPRSSGTQLEQLRRRSPRSAPPAAAARGPSARRGRSTSRSLVGRRREPVDGVGRQQHRPPGPQRLDHLVVPAATAPPRPAPCPARSSVIADVGVAGGRQQRGDVAGMPLVHLEHEPAVEHARRVARPAAPSAPRRRAPRAAPSRAPRARARRARPARRTAGSRRRGRTGPSTPSSRSARTKVDVEPVRARVLARERERVSRQRRSRPRARPGARARSRARSRRVPVPTSSTRGASHVAISARQRSTTISVSGRGTSARASVCSVSRRKSQSPST